MGGLKRLAGLGKLLRLGSLLVVLEALKGRQLLHGLEERLASLVEALVQLLGQVRLLVEGLLELLYLGIELGDLGDRRVGAGEGA